MHITQLKGWHCEQLRPSSFKGTQEYNSSTTAAHWLYKTPSVARHSATLEILKNVKNKKNCGNN